MVLASLQQSVAEAETTVEKGHSAQTEAQRAVAEAEREHSTASAELVGGAAGVVNCGE